MPSEIHYSPGMRIRVQESVEDAVMQNAISGSHAMIRVHVLSSGKTPFERYLNPRYIISIDPVGSHTG